MKNWTIYLSLSIVFVASIAAASFAPVSEFISGMIVVPGVGALVGALFQIARDSAAFEKQKHLQTDQHVFSLGASSHMSTVAFDKHVAFCEAYLSEVHETVGVLFREGPTEKAMECAYKLFALKREYAAWIPKSVALELEPFENAINEIGVKTHLVNALRGTRDEARSKALDESYNVFANVMGMEKLKEEAPDHKEELAVENVKESVREILGINELFEIRNFIIKRSADFARRIT
ncbi:hypothetical protein SAMN05660420_03149 [Desulfuromusa kysingii]|uniref:Uncharacterized protein n=1 Tax=Desulfuromusa kysingii TaxID=37625 RepID=A0A1H4DY34_9BACT|nr:hypothetical protein [Desulfuromusa kysingii]SEA77704.1 hypothetical protein SAMN05660420_03149 [Desulfuromusa kysingii]